MAEFCLQCARDSLGLENGENDFSYLGHEQMPLEPGVGWDVLCEGCGRTIVDNDGRCIYHFCDKHGEENRKNAGLPHSEA